MQIEKGMYVRTKEGDIDKIIDIEYLIDDEREEYTQCLTEEFTAGVEIKHYKSWIKKASHNIIDLIEQHDIIDGIELLDMDVWEDFKNDGNIKTILTHEQYEKHAYKLEV